jgi:serine O-acetyltransferase
MTMDRKRSETGHAQVQPSVSAEVADWSRESKPIFAWAPSRSLLASLRAYERHSRSRDPWHGLLRKAAVLRHRFWSVVTGADIPLGSRIGGGLLLPHPNGVVIHPSAEIGPNCLIFQQVTIGMNGGGLPRIGGHVDFGAGAKVLGAITVGDHACIGANAVVLIDVPPHGIAVGVPATLKERHP